MFVVARGAARWGHLPLILLAVAIPLFLVAAWLDPQRPARQRAELTHLQMNYARQETWLLAQARAEPTMGRLNLNFEKLSFRLPPQDWRSAATDKGIEKFIPAGIKQYDSRQIRIRGYLLPTKMEEGLVTEGLVLANQMSCCYGREPRFCEFILAHMDGRGVPAMMDRPLSFEGTLHVGDVFTDGYWVALYSMTGTSVNR